MIRIGDITPRLNFSTVKVEGFLVSDARLLRGGSVLYQLNDGSGVLPVFYDDAPAGPLPKAGCFICATGNLSVGAGNNIRLRVLSSDQVQIKPTGHLEKRSGELKFAEVTHERDGDRITVRGRVSGIWNPPEGSQAPHKIMLIDSSGALEAIHWFVPEQGVSVGSELQVTGTVSLYRGNLQLKIHEPDALLVLR